jgi:hypothetical protein
MARWLESFISLTREKVGGRNGWQGNKLHAIENSGHLFRNKGRVLIEKQGLLVGRFQAGGMLSDEGCDNCDSYFREEKLLLNAY